VVVYLIWNEICIFTKFFKRLMKN